MSRVGIWMTNYGNEKHLPRAFDTVLGQSFKDFTLYVFDNHSPEAARRTIRDYAEIDKRVVVVPIPEGLSGIQLMRYGWNYLITRNHDYTITLGGHDFWNQAEFLEIAVERMDAEAKARGDGRPVALLYFDTWQVDEENNVCGRYGDIMQVVQIDKPVLPHYAIMGVNSPHLFGLWNEKVRRDLAVRHPCGGWDHLVVMEAALHGDILWEPRVQLVMRRPAPGDSLEKYGMRHFDAARRAGKAQDFIEELEWCQHVVRQNLGGVGGIEEACLQASMALAYIVFRSRNLAMVPDGPQDFFHRPQVQEILKGALHVSAMVSDLTRSAKRE